MKYTHICSCGEKYTDDDPDLYFCPSCIEKRKEVAKSVDAKMVNMDRTKKPSLLEMYDSLPKGRGFVRAQDIM